MVKKGKYAGPRVRDTKTFIKRAEWVHGEKYDYSKTTYTKQKDIGTFICDKHGIFYQNFGSHLAGHGCQHCAKENTDSKRSITTEDFINKSKLVHGNIYDYSKSIVNNSTTKVCIRCEIHGEFWQTPANHYRNKQGCPTCGGTGKMTTEDFIKKSKRVHGDAYDYSKVEYKNNKKQVVVVCSAHGDFATKPNNHLMGSGCPSCAAISRWVPSSSYGLRGYYGTTRESSLYVVNISNKFIKVGLAKELTKRLNKLRRSSGLDVGVISVVDGRANDLWDLEQKILRKSNLKRFYPEDSFAGSTECLHLSELPKVLQIIEDWEKSNEESFSETS